MVLRRLLVVFPEGFSGFKQAGSFLGMTRPASRFSC